MTKSNKKWVVMKRYSDFDSLDKTLRSNSANLPTLPGKTLFKMSQEQQIEDRKTVLNQYIKVSVSIIKVTHVLCIELGQQERYENFSPF